jgi:hypothetical protein
MATILFFPSTYKKKIAEMSAFANPATPQHLMNTTAHT